MTERITVGNHVLEYRERETAPRHDPGIDYGAKAQVLARFERKTGVRLVFRGGSMVRHGARGFGRYYVGATLELKQPREFLPISDERGGRLTKARVEAMAEKINEAFGFDITPHIRLDRTLVIIGE